MSSPAQKPPAAGSPPGAPPNNVVPGPGAAAPGPQVLKLKKGQLLFAEGENSRAMYFLKTGMIRIFKKKGDSSIEIDTIHSGQVVGELAFLDGNPRSASGEALTDCELGEISGPTFQAVLARMPDWLKILLKTVVGRLRTASTRIRQLEQASTAYDYSDKDGKRAAHYIYLGPIDVLKLSTAILLVGSRNGKPAATGGGVELRMGLLSRYSNQIMGVPVAKLTTYLDVLCQVGIAASQGDDKYTLHDPDFLEQLIQYLNEENLLEPSKRHDINLRGFLIMSLVAKNMGRYKPDPKTGLTKVNLAEIRKVETGTTGKEPFRMEEFPELVRLGYATNVAIKSTDEAYTDVKAEEFIRSYRMQRVVMALNAVNEQKRKGGGGPAR